MSPKNIAETPPSSRFSLSTEEFATQYRVKPQTVLKQHSSTGSYFGVRPLPLPNRHLLWPNDSIDALVSSKFGGLS